jgi:hypothetical protein
MIREFKAGQDLRKDELVYISKKGIVWKYFKKNDIYNILQSLPTEARECDKLESMEA